MKAQFRHTQSVESPLGKCTFFLQPQQSTRNGGRNKERLFVLWTQLRSEPQPGVCFSAPLRPFLLPGSFFCQCKAKPSVGTPTGGEPFRQRLAAARSRAGGWARTALNPSARRERERERERDCLVPCFEAVAPYARRLVGASVFAKAALKAHSMGGPRFGLVFVAFCCVMA